MTIGTFAQLQTAVLDWTHRADLSTQCPDFVALCEARLNDMLILRNMETETTIPSVASQNYIALPAGYVSPIALWGIFSGSIRTLLDAATAEELPYNPNNARPQYWAIDGDNIRFDCPVDAIYSMPFRYVKASNLSVSNTTNQLLSKRPDIYLAGTIVELARYVGGEGGAALFGMWEPKFLQGCKEVRVAEDRNREIAPLRVDAGLLGRTLGRFNIFRGD